eukprot:scaffold133249_cov52-Phaeocystis_antarctica.AAC.1
MVAAAAESGDLLLQVVGKPLTTHYLLPPTAHCLLLLPTAHCLLLLPTTTAYCLLPTPTTTAYYCLLLPNTAYCLLLLPTAYYSTAGRRSQPPRLLPPAARSLRSGGRGAPGAPRPATGGEQAPYHGF